MKTKNLNGKPEPDFRVGFSDLVRHQDESGSAQSQTQPDSGENRTPQYQRHRLTDVELLRWMAECPHGLDGLAKTSHEKALLREWLDQWKAAGFPEIKRREPLVPHAVSSSPQDCAELGNRSYGGVPNEKVSDER